MTGPRAASRRRSGTGLAVVAAAAATLAGCGVGAQGSPQALGRDSVPYGLLNSHSRTKDTVPAFGSVKVTLWLEGGDEQLSPVQAFVAWPETIGGLLNALAQGPTQQQSEQGLVSPASSFGPLSSGRTQHGVVPVELPASFENLGGGDQLIAAAQIVYTLTGFSGVSGVTFSLAGQRARVPNAVGKLLAGPLTRADYSALTH